jgi:DNA modification methylase
MTPHYETPEVTLWHGDCLDVLARLGDASVDAVVTDPPYGLEFMGKEWDAPWKAEGAVVTDPASVGGFQDGAGGNPYSRSRIRFGIGAGFQKWCEDWAAECLRVLKPGGHLLAFGGTRTWHRLACAIEDAGFEVRDSIAWMYGSGFPLSSLDVSKAIDKQRTEDRAPVDAVRAWLNARRLEAGFSHDAVNKHFGHASNGGGSSSAWMTNPTSRALPTWEQWQALKALFGFGDEMDAEVWRLNGRKGKPGDNFEAREVLSERVAIVEGGKGGWADMVASGRFKPGEKVIRDTAPATDAARTWQGWGTALKPAFEPIVVARKPLSGTVAGNVLAHGTGALNIDGCRIAGEKVRTTRTTALGVMNDDGWQPRPGVFESHDAGRWPANVVLDETQAAALDQQSGEGVSRVGKPRGADAGDGWGMTATGAEYDDLGGASRFFYVAKADASERPKVGGVAHPTVKPLALMRWLVRLVTPPGGVVLEPFAGSGTTVEACLLEGFRCVAIEKGDEYLPLIEARIHRRRDPVAAARLAATGDDEASLFDLLNEEGA